MAKATRSNHILPTAANLLGFTFLVLTSIRGLGLETSRTLETLTGVSVIGFALSTLLSFQSLRTQDRATRVNYEKWADGIFVLALAACTLLSILLVFDIA